jgi:hypothetical protein
MNRRRSHPDTFIPLTLLLIRKLKCRINLPVPLIPLLILYLRPITLHSQIPVKVRKPSHFPPPHHFPAYEEVGDVAVFSERSVHGFESGVDGVAALVNLAVGLLQNIIGGEPGGCGLGLPEFAINGIGVGFHPFHSRVGACGIVPGAGVNEGGSGGERHGE